MAGKSPSNDIGDPNFQYHFVLEVIIHVIAVCTDCPWIADDYTISTNRYYQVWLFDGFKVDLSQSFLILHPYPRFVSLLFLVFLFLIAEVISLLPYDFSCIIFLVQWWIYMVDSWNSNNKYSEVKYYITLLFIVVFSELVGRQWEFLIWRLFQSVFP